MSWNPRIAERGAVDQHLMLGLHRRVFYTSSAAGQPQTGRIERKPFQAIRYVWLKQCSTDRTCNGVVGLRERAGDGARAGEILNWLQ
jgi:hypothetical protein